MLIGVVAGLLANVLWGLTFVAPLAVAPYQPFDVVLGRTIVFGAASLAFLAFSGFRDADRAGPTLRRSAILFGAVGFNLYFLLMALATPLAGSAIVALIIGALPVAMALGGNRGADRIAIAKLAPPLVVIAAGLILVNGAAAIGAPTPGDGLRLAAGVALTLAAFAAWYWYGMANAALLRAAPLPIQSLAWTALCGVGALVSLPAMALAAFLFDLSALPRLGLHDPAALRFLLWCLVIGLAASFLATWLWMVASRRLPVSLAAQMIVAETLSALAFTFFLAGRGPTLAEALAAILLVSGVLWSVRIFARN